MHSRSQPLVPSSAGPFASRAQSWQIARRCLALPRRPLVMGILNVTPDSFSDGGSFIATNAAIERGLAIEAEGADILDIGGESTRPYSESVDQPTELARVMPVIEALAPRLSIPISIDTSKAAVARAAMDAGAEIINDVTGLAGDREMLTVARRSAAGVCIMHMQGTPQTMQDNPSYADVVEDILVYLRQRRDDLVREGIKRARIALDPGVGFGKTHEHNLALVANAWRFHELGCPVLVGHSRKGFLAKIIGDSSADRTAATVGASIALGVQGVQVVRVHDVAAVRQALAAFEAGGGFTHGFSSAVDS
jgi:dihydropteroate synthase